MMSDCILIVGKNSSHNDVVTVPSITIFVTTRRFYSYPESFPPISILKNYRESVTDQEGFVILTELPGFVILFDATTTVDVPGTVS